MDIVEELRKDRENGARRLETEYKAGLMALARRFCNDPGDAEELVNATLAEVVENVDDFLEQSSLFTWMCKILISKFSRANRRKSNRMEVYPGEVPEMADEKAQEAIYDNLDASLLRDAIETLPPDIRKTVVMHYFMDIPVADIAKVLSIRTGTVKWRLHNARLALAAKLGVAARKPGGRALLLALAISGLTALGAGVATLVGALPRSARSGHIVEMPLPGGPRSVAAAAAGPPGFAAAGTEAGPPDGAPSVPSSTKGETMNTRTTTLLSAALGAALSTGAALPASAGVLDADAGVYVITVPAGETNELSAADVSAASGYAIAKRGGGVLAADATAAAFSGEIRIEEGVWLVSGKGGLGTGAGGASVSDGAALHLSDGSADNIRLATGAVALTLCGPGPDGLGAVRNVGSAKQTKIFNNGGSLALSGDATIGGANLGLSTATAKPPVNLNGHSFTVAMDSGASLTLSASSFATAGDIVIAAGRLLLNGATVWTGGAENTVTVRNGAQLGFYDVANPVPWSLALENGSSIYPQYGDVEADATPNVWAGPVTVASGRVDVYYSDSASTGVHFSGPVGGAGGFRLAGATALRLSCPTNTFANGVVLNGASTTAGGLILDATGALPAESAIENVIGGGKGYRQRVVAAPGIALPDMAFSREGILENLSGGAPAAIGTLGKVNNNPFTLSGGIAVTNILSVSGNGAVSFAADTAAYAGLYMAATNFSTTKATAQTEVQSYFGISGKINNASNARGTLTEPMLKDMAAKLLADIPNEEVATPDLAYRAWTGDEAQRFAAYRGHFLNTEGTNVVASFATSIADIAAVWIDGDCVVMNVGSKALTGGSSSTYFVTLGEAELTPGSHEIEILLGHIATSSNGPKSLVAGDVAAGVDWQVANFGLGWRLGGIDPSATTNAADYAAISNTADRLLLVREAGDALGASRPAVKAISVAVADNALSFGADSLALPYEVADFTGTTEITSGALRVTNRWTLAAADVAARPLSVASGASLDLTGTTLFSPDWRALGRIAHEGVTIAEADDASALTGLPALPVSLENGWSIKRELDGAGGVEIKLFYSASFIMIIR